MTRTFLIAFGGLALTYWTIGILDWFGRRQERRRLHKRAV
jgi:hypothetical protein